MNYKVLDKNDYKSNGYELLPYRQEDMLLIMGWRNDQMDFLRQNKLLTAEDQEKYFRDVIEPSIGDESTRIILFSFLKDGKCIGYGGLTNIDWESKRAEVSFLLETNRGKEEAVYREDFSVFLDLLKEVVFLDLNFHRLFTETYDIRPLHIKVLESNGFKLEGRMEDHTIITGKYVDSLIHGIVNN